MKSLSLLKSVALGALLIVLAAGCRRDYVRPHGYYGNNYYISGLLFVNASPDAPGVNLYLNENRVNGLYGYTDNSQYFNAYSGTRAAHIYEGGTKKFSSDIVLKDNRYYSLFLAGRFATPELVFLEDSLKMPASGKTHIRFVNMSLDAPSLDLGLADGTTLVSGRTYKQNSAYIPVDGDTQYTFVIRENGATTAKVTLPATTLARGRSYTIWVKGAYNDSGLTGVGAEIMRNY
jgi:hypothetical protein